MYVYICIYICTYMYVYMYMYTYIYTHTRKNRTHIWTRVHTDQTTRKQGMIEKKKDC